MIRKLAGLCAAAAIVACDSAPTSAPDVSQAPRLNFMNGPNELPKILRFEERVVLGWVDEERNMGIIIGQSLIPGDARLCGGPTRSQFVDVQLVGDLIEFEGAVKQLAQNKDAAVLVYDEVAPSLEEALCESEPAATGTGFFRRVDNDLFGTGGNRANAPSEHLHGTVELAGGGTAVVNAWLKILAVRGELVSAETSILLTPTGN